MCVNTTTDRGPPLLAMSMSSKYFCPPKISPYGLGGSEIFGKPLKANFSHYYPLFGGFLSHRGTPKSSILVGFSLTKTNHFGYHPFMETSIYRAFNMFTIPRWWTPTFRIGNSDGVVPPSGGSGRLGVEGGWNARRDPAPGRFGIFRP